MVHQPGHVHRLFELTTADPLKLRCRDRPPIILQPAELRREQPVAAGLVVVVQWHIDSVGAVHVARQMAQRGRVAEHVVVQRVHEEPQGHLHRGARGVAKLADGLHPAAAVAAQQVHRGEPARDQPRLKALLARGELSGEGIRAHRGAVCPGRASHNAQVRRDICNGHRGTAVDQRIRAGRQAAIPARNGERAFGVEQEFQAIAAARPRRDHLCVRRKAVEGLRYEGPVQIEFGVNHDRVKAPVGQQLCRELAPGAGRGTGIEHALPVHMYGRPGHELLQVVGHPTRYRSLLRDEGPDGIGAVARDDLEHIADGEVGGRAGFGLIGRCHGEYPRAQHQRVGRGNKGGELLPGYAHRAAHRLLLLVERLQGHDVVAAQLHQKLGVAADLGLQLPLLVAVAHRPQHIALLIRQNIGPAGLAVGYRTGLHLTSERLHTEHDARRPETGSHFDHLLHLRVATRHPQEVHAHRQVPHRQVQRVAARIQQNGLRGYPLPDHIVDFDAHGLCLRHAQVNARVGLKRIGIVGTQSEPGRHLAGSLQRGHHYAHQGRTIGCGYR